VIQELLSKREDTGMKIGEKRSVAILFSDIRSFTVISENNSAEKIVAFLNRYFQLMVRIIREQGGTIDKFIGDAILAVFGAPVSFEDNAARAVRAATAMAAALQDFDTSGLVLPEGGFRTGIGIHEGDVIVGNIGSEDKFDYTVIGDNVNLASRLESLTKYYHTSIILSDDVRRTIGESLPTREVDTVRVMGREQATTLYTVDPPDQVQEDDVAGEAYRKGISMYKMGNWTTAIDYFKHALARLPEDYLCQMYIDRCREFAVNPPPPDWEGAIRLDFK
jgi:adenylate cyclase